MEDLINYLLSLIVATIMEIFVVGACLDVNNNKKIGTTFKKVIMGEK